MANVEHANQRGGRPGGMGMPFLSLVRGPDPRRLGFFSTLKSILCPYFKPVSFIFMMCLIDTAMYVFAVAYSLVVYNGLDSTGNVFLGPTAEALIDLGAKVPSTMRSRSTQSGCTGSTASYIAG